jgi:hypothetical protein
MAPRLFLAFLVLGAAVTAALGQSTGAVAPPASAQDVQIMLETRWVWLSDDLGKRAGVDLKLPAAKSAAVRDKQQVEAIFQLAHGDKRSNAGPPKTIVVPNAEKREFSPFGRDKDLQGCDQVQATVSDDRQTVKIELTWAKWQDGTEHLPATNVALPVGSHLLVHSKEIFETLSTDRSPWQKIKDRLLNKQPPPARLEKANLFLLISPRIALPGEQEPARQTTAR